MSRVKHIIKGIPYWYEHIRVGKVVVCKYIGRADGQPDGRRTTNAATRLSNSTMQIDLLGECKYASQEELDAYIKKSYTRGKIGVKRIQTIFADELGLHPTRREVENYLTGDLGLELRKRASKKQVVEPSNDATKSDLAQARESISMRKIEIDSKDVQIKTMKCVSMDDAQEILRLKNALRDYRDMGRAPTDDEFEELIG